MEFVSCCFSAGLVQPGGKFFLLVFSVFSGLYGNVAEGFFARQRAAEITVACSVFFFSAPKYFSSHWPVNAAT